MTRKPKSYIICSTPRTGSTLLCGLLKSSGIAGTPESYFRTQDFNKWAKKYGLSKDYRFEEFLNATIKAGSTPNGVFGVRIMWGTMTELTDDLAALYPNESDLLTRAFGPCKFIYLKREDYVAQAVSRLRAEQTDIWHVDNGGDASQAAPNPEYNFEQLQEFVQEAEAHNKAWGKWFTRNGVEPYRVSYEALAKEPQDATRRIHDFLGLCLPEDVSLNTTNKRLSDELNKEWIARYHFDVEQNNP